MTEYTKSSIGEGGIYAYALIAVTLLALSSGCLSSQYGNSDYGQSQPTTTNAVVSGLTVSGTPETTQATTSMTAEDKSQADFSQVSLAIAGCDDDYYENAMVAGYVTNNGTRLLASVPIVTQLLSPDGAVVSGGEKTTMISNLKPGETQKFSATYVTPPQWKKCRASVNGDWAGQ